MKPRTKNPKNNFRAVIYGLFVFALLATLPLQGQVVTVTIQGRVYDTTGAAIPQAMVTAVNAATGFSRSATATSTGDYQISFLPVGDYTVTADKTGFQKQAKKVHLDVGAAGDVDFSLAPGQVLAEVTVQDMGEVAEPTRVMVSSVIDQHKIQSLPVNGRQFIDFALLAPGVTVGDTTSGSTDVIIEPVTKLSFAGQNIHYNFVGIDGADNMSTASGIQKTTPSAEAVQEFRVINSSYSTEFGRAVGGIVNIITKSGTNELHGSAYEYFRNDAMDAKSELAAKGFNKLRQNQFGGSLGGPIRKDKTFYYANYEGQRHTESPFYNQTVLDNLNCPAANPGCTDSINYVKVNVWGLPAENLYVNRVINYDNVLARLDHTFNQKNSMFVRYFFNDQRSTNLSPLNDGFDLPSGFKNNDFTDQSIVGDLVTAFSPTLVNEVRAQYAHRTFNFPTVSTQPHLEVSNVFTLGVNRGNPEFYQEGRFEILDNVTKILGRHTISFGGDFNHVSTTESFPLFYPFEADFGSLDAFLGTDFVGAPHPFVIFFERFDAASGFTEPTFDTSVYLGHDIASNLSDQAKGEIGHTYEGLYIQDKWRATPSLTINYGLRWEAETWPSVAINNVLKNFDPRVGFSYAPGGKNFVIRGGGGLFHGTIPSPLIMCQIPSCGGIIGKFPGRENIQDDMGAKTRLSAAGSDPFTMAFLLSNLLGPGLTTATYPAPSLDAVIARFAQEHQPPYGAQVSLGVEVQPFRDAVLSITGMHVRGIHLGSFYNVNQPDPSGQLPFHDSAGNVGMKDMYCANFPCFPPVISPGVRCAVFTPCAPDLPPLPPDSLGYAVDFEADSKWDSQWDGLLVNFQKRMSHHYSFGVSYTWGKGIDDGPNPSFVLIPQDSCCLRRERAVSSDSISQRFVANAIVTGPEHMNAILNGWQLSTIISLQTPDYFTKFAGFDANGDIFGNNDRVGTEGRNTFRGDQYQAVDLRLSRIFNLTERVQLQAIAEAFNLTNTLNVKFFNTAYGASDFCPAGGATYCGTGPFFTEGSPNQSYGTPRAIFNPRQIQLAVRFTW